MIEYISLENAAVLDDFVIHHPYGHYMQTSFWGRARPEWRWQGILLRKNGKICASIALLSRPLRLPCIWQFYAPRGPVFDDLDSFAAIISAAAAFVRRHGGYGLRIDPPIAADDRAFADAARSLGFSIDARDDFSAFQARLVYRTDLTDLKSETLLYRLHPGTRYNIRLAQRRGVTVRQGRVDELPIFCAMMEETAARDGFVSKPLSFYRGVMTAFGSRARLYFAEKDGEVLAGAMNLTMGRRSWNSYSCSFTHRRVYKPNELLQWQMLRDAMEAGCTCYDFRGVQGRPDPTSTGWGLHRFKRGFAAELVMYVGQLDLTVCPWKAAIVCAFHRFKNFCRE